jgi:colanic acid biosynthesis glycosyl transferase WcaI
VQLSRALAERGHDVLHLYSSDAQSPKADLRRRPADPPGFLVEGLSLGARARASFLRQRFQDMRLGRHVARRAMAFKPDVMIACNNPLHVQSAV